MDIQVLERKNWMAIVLVALAAVLAMVLVISVQPADASDGKFDLTVKHGINGRSLGLDKDLPVDVYVNDSEEPVFSFKFKEIISVSLPEGEYKIDVKLAGTNTTVMSLGPTDIPAGVDVDIRAKLSADKTPILKVKVK
ncbi:MAG: DUF4397 domain-containing protein [Chloroflexota bacterium]|nr:MAG: DUF4397 domain-containing protein [Chloroflexota bacterium]